MALRAVMEGTGLRTVVVGTERPVERVASEAKL